MLKDFWNLFHEKCPSKSGAWIAYLIESKWENKELTINTDEELTKFVEIEETRYNENSEIEQHYKYR